ncbi:ATP-grasp domain-containing protein, partial [Saprospiraceae bacterium]|nr:ATP-grasp domain-containing protein [Saprospiraceae bacterium]
ITDPKKAKVIAKEIGFPILIKASAGGGGKGMRVVESEDVLEEQMNRAISEALSAFGDGSVFIEKYISSPRHIEIQVLADSHGNVVHLFERECSIQRRHQKVVEEAPSAVLTAQLRERMGEAAIKVAKSCNYEGAGTVEFLLDSDNNFYFLEMNTRLQVEHPVTEYITGVDLVAEQIKVARGEKLSFTQDDLKIKGHAVELRIYAEDPLNDFLPSIGILETYIRPIGEGVRVDDGYEQGMEIPIYYDPMIAKLITYADTRTAAIQKMKQAIADYKIVGLETTLPFGKFVMENEQFISGDIDTHFVKKYYSPEALLKGQNVEKALAAEIAIKYYQEQKNKLSVTSNGSDEWLKRRT